VEREKRRKRCTFRENRETGQAEGGCFKIDTGEHGKKRKKTSWGEEKRKFQLRCKKLIREH